METLSFEGPQPWGTESQLFFVLFCFVFCGSFFPLGKREEPVLFSGSWVLISKGWSQLLSDLNFISEAATCVCGGSVQATVARGFLRSPTHHQKSGTDGSLISRVCWWKCPLISLIGSSHSSLCFGLGTVLGSVFNAFYSRFWYLNHSIIYSCLDCTPKSYPFPA